MKTPFTPASTPRSTQKLRQLSPQKQEWALINQYKALEFEILKQKQRMLAQQKKNNFKRQLDHQLSSKNNVQQKQFEADRKYYEYITNQASIQKEREQREKMNRILKRKQAQQTNGRSLQMARNSRLNDHDTGYHLDIGHKSEEQNKIKSQNIKKTMLDTLDQQLKEKFETKEKSKYKQFETDVRNLQYQNDFYQNRGQYQKNFSQNQRVYQYYQQLERQKRIKDMEIQYRFVDEAADRKRMIEDQRIRNQQMKKTMIKGDIKESLDRQVRVHNMKKVEESKINPQDYSYGVIGNVFRQRQASYDKAKYVEELKAQAEQQKRRKKMENYMSEEEYKFNMNQLNKVVNGEYAHNSYLDRSLGTIGDNKLLKLADIKDSIQDRDADAVKYRLQNLRQRNHSTVISRNDRSF